MTKKKTKLPLLHSSVSLIDSHCHLDMNSYEKDLKEVLNTSYNSGVRSIITIGIDIDSSTAAVNLAARYSMIHATVGIHPHDVANIKTKDFDTIASLIDKSRNQIVGYGEIGLDYVKQYSPRDVQLKYFADQLLIAKNHRLPVIIHDREAHDDILNVLQKCGPYDHGGIMHCFSGNIEHAKKVMDLGFHISIPGIVTFKNALDLQRVAAEIPLEVMLLETDGPFLAPDPFRGKRNEPGYLLYTADKIARLRDITIEEVAAQTTSNCTQLFNISIPEQAGV